MLVVLHAFGVTHCTLPTIVLARFAEHGVVLLHRLYQCDPSRLRQFLVHTSSCPSLSTHLPPFICWVRCASQALDHEVRSLPNVAILGDFNASSRLACEASELHRRLASVTDQCSMLRDPNGWRHFLPRPAPRIADSWAMTALGFAEQRLGYLHCWQAEAALGGGEGSSMPPLYSHWSGQLIDHCLLRGPAAASGKMGALAVTNVGVYHTDASDHLPLVVDLQMLPS
mmetsp:Transcript_149148/g.477692  ORF Transcript_149148/g.477692 Transcript_149148/m.477692 type:complete len:227 (+) Transcript_149148:2-682(+)